MGVASLSSIHWSLAAFPSKAIQVFRHIDSAEYVPVMSQHRRLLRGKLGKAIQDGIIASHHDKRTHRRR
jgi:hypothetical protein